MAVRRRRARHELLKTRSAKRRAEAYGRIRDAIAAGEDIFNEAGESLTTGAEFHHEVSPYEVTPFGKALNEVIEAALDGLEAAAREVVGPAAVKNAPILAAAGPGTRAGRVGGNQGGTIGELRASMRVDPDRENGRVGISFNTIYAALQHERMDWSHTDGHAKYLERAMIDNRDKVLEVIAEHVREVTGGDE